MHRMSRLAIVAAVIAAACSDSVSGPPPVLSTGMGVSNVKVTPDSLSLAVGTSFALIGTVDAPREITDRRVMWSSSDTTIATVDGNGVLIARHAGTTTIIAASKSDPTVRARAIVVSTNASPGMNRIPRPVIIRRASVALAR
jgi:hypothetical protein